MANGVVSVNTQEARDAVISLGMRSLHLHNLADECLKKGQRSAAAAFRAKGNKLSELARRFDRVLADLLHEDLLAVSDEPYPTVSE